MVATVLPFQQISQEYLIPQKNWGFSAASYQFLATKLMQSNRYVDLDRRSLYYRCQQHDHKQYDFDGRTQAPGAYTVTQPLMGNMAAPFYVPLRDRRPCAPLRLGKQIVSSFTKMTFGEDRWPDLLCKEDEVTQDFIVALSEQAKLPVRMIQARNKAGSQGAVGLSWYFHEGKAVVEIHDIKTLFVHEWADKSQWKPKHVTKCYRTSKSVWDNEQKAIVNKEYWYRRDWTTQADIIYCEVEAKANCEPAWEIDEKRSSIHGDNFCHFVWMQNVPSEEQDSEPDYDGLYEKLDEIDTINSVVCRGAKLNLDPTLKLKMDPEAIGSAMVKKGSDHALVTGLAGDAAYLEISGAGLDAGGKLVDRLTQQILDEAECVIPDPEKVAAGSVSSVSLKIVYAPMLSKVGLIRQTTKDAIVELLNQMLRVCRARWTEMVSVIDEQGNKTEETVTNYLSLPPNIIEEPVMDELGEPTGEVSIVLVDREPGQGREIELQWGPLFAPNSVDIQSIVTSMNLATAGKAVISQKSAVEVVASVLGKDPVKIMDEITGDHKKDLAMNGSMFGLPGAGDTLTADDAAPVDLKAELEKGAAQEMEEHDLDEAAARKIAGEHLQEDPNYYRVPEPAQVAIPGTPGAPGTVPGTPGSTGVAPVDGASPTVASAPAEVTLTSSDLASIVTVNEARARYGMGPKMLGDKPDPDGDLTLTAFKAKSAAMVAAAASAEKGQDPNAPVKVAKPPFGA